MCYHQFNAFERGRIEESISLGLPNRIIAKCLGRNRSTIDRELRRSSTKARAIAKLYRSLQKEAFKTGITDRGEVVACYNKVYAKLVLPLYFADASW